MFSHAATAFRTLLLAALLVAPSARAQSGAPGSADSDLDGVIDSIDAEPCNAQVSARVYVPADRTYGMMLFEDQWPSRGDFDFNDAVIGFNEVLRYDSAAQLTGLRMEFSVLAVGAGALNGLAIRLPGTPRASVTSIVQTVGNVVQQGQLDPQAEEATIILSPNLHKLFYESSREWVNTDAARPSLPYVNIVVELELGPGHGLSGADAPFDLFLFNRDRGTEVHRPRYRGTPAMNAALYNTADDGSTLTRSFVTSSGIPFALELPELTNYPREEAAIDLVYPSIVEFGSSSGAQAADFYRHLAPGFAFALTQPDAIAQATGDRSCLPAQVPPTANFHAAPPSGEAPHSIIVQSSATAGSAALTSVLYDYGDGQGFETDLVHTYLDPGTYTITQRVVDANGLVATATRTVTVTASSFVPVLLNPADARPWPELSITADGLGMDVISGSNVGVRSNRAIQPGSGIFYYEGERTTSVLGQMRFGVAPASLPLTASPGNTATSVGVDTSGSIWHNGGYRAGFPAALNAHYGLVVDYRGANPIVHVIVHANDPRSWALSDRVHTSVTLPTTEPLYIFASGIRRKVGPQARINPGNDTTNFPFRYDAAAILNAVRLDGSALVAGWGQTRARPLNAAPVLTIDAATPVSVTPGTTVTLTASAVDAEDGTLSSRVQWSDLSTVYGTRQTTTGASFTFSPTALGIHPISAVVTDSRGKKTEVVFDVTVTGALPQFNPVRMVPDSRSGAGIVLSPDGLSAKWTGFGKYGLRANQGMIGRFWYFEMTRHTATANQGGGGVIADGNLNPYASIDVPQSCSVNHGAGIWRNIISLANYDASATTTYGIAVDYRGRHPIVYFITRSAATSQPVVAHVMTLDDVTVPLYPMLYGNPVPGGALYDASINFGATPFTYSPMTVLAAGGYSAQGLQLGWGDAYVGPLP